MDKKSQRGSYRRAFGAGASEWEHKTEEEIQQAEKDRRGAESSWESSVGGNKSEGSKVAIIASIVIATVTVIGVIAYVLLSQSNSEAERIALSDSDEVALEGFDASEGGLMIGTVEQVSEKEEYVYQHKDKGLVAIVEGFLESQTHEERLTYIVRPSVYGEAMRDFFEHQDREVEEISSISPAGAVKSNGVQFNQLFVSFKDGSHRLAAVVETQGGRLIDFEAYSRACSIPLNKLLKEGGDCQYARVSVEAVSYFNGVFSDDAEYCSFLLTSPDLGDEVMYGYAKHDDPTAQAMKLLVNEGLSPRMILRLQSLEDSHKRNQFHIEHVYCSGWVKAGLDVEKMIAKRIEALLLEKN